MRKNRVEFICQHCHKKFDVPFSETYRRKAGVKYCSMACYHAARWERSGVCRNCGKPTKTRFCTPECQKEFWNKYENSSAPKQKRIWERKIELIKSLGGKCSHCGNDDLRVLDINHIDRSQKHTYKTGNYNWAHRLKDWEKNKENIEILCANCHRIHTWEQMGYGVGLPEGFSLVEKAEAVD